MKNFGKNKPIKINLGCGSDYREGWVNVDALEYFQPDLVHDLTSPLPFPDQSVTYILAQDILEHFTKEDLPILLKEIGRLVQKNGQVEIRVPSVSAIYSRLAAFPEARNQFLYGTTEHTGIFGVHKVGLTPEYLTHLFISQGFSVTQWTVCDTNYHAIFTKTNRKISLQSVAVLAHTFGLGGAEQFITQLAEYFKQQDIDVEVWTNYQPWIQLLKSKNISTKKVPVAIDVVGDWKGLLKALLLLPLVFLTDGWVVWQMRKNTAILLAGFSQKPTVSWWAALWRRPLVWIEFGPLESVLSKFHQLPKLWYYLAKSLPQLVVVPSSHTFQHLISGAKIDLAKLRKVPCAVRLENQKAKTITSINNRVVCVSRLEPGKGQDRLITAFKIVVKRIPTAELRIVGEGGFSTELSTLIKKHQLEKRVQLVGRVADVATEMQQASICVLPSTWPLEGFGLTLIEAMAMGKPVIAFDQPPLNELVVHGQTGILVPDDSTNQEKALADAIIDLLNNHQLQISLGKKAKNYVQKNYLFDQIGPMYVGVLEEALARRQAQKELLAVGWSRVNE